MSQHTDSISTRWVSLNLNSPLLYCVQCFRLLRTAAAASAQDRPQLQVTTFHVLTCGHIFCDEHIGSFHRESDGSGACSHCHLTGVQAYAIDMHNPRVPPEIAIYFDDFLVVMQRTMESIKYSYGSLVYLLQHYQQVSNSDVEELRRELQFQKATMARTIPALEKIAFLETFVNFITP
ncbi:uncharacterized protein V1518DRAFT_426280 [Limtongia smithiae]|uniref:uncharacterized protein n=1 Tax=Limtongia smithiae TaxID=1125753 RepID=UPI0034CF3D86